MREARHDWTLSDGSEELYVGCEYGSPDWFSNADQTEMVYELLGMSAETRVLRAEVSRLSALVPRWVPAWERRPLTAGDYRVCCGRSVHGRHGYHPASGWDPSPLPPTHWLEVPIPPLPGTEP